MCFCVQEPILNEQLPDEMCTLFDLNCNVHNYSTRSRELIHIPKYKKRIFQFNIRYTGPKLWNDLPDPIKKSLSVSSLKFKLKQDKCDCDSYMPPPFSDSDIDRCDP